MGQFIHRDSFIRFYQYIGQSTATNATTVQILRRGSKPQSSAPRHTLVFLSRKAVKQKNIDLS